MLFGALALLWLVSPQHFLHLLNRDSFGWAPAQSGGGLPRHMPLSIRRCNTEYIMRYFSTIVKQETRKNANFLPSQPGALPLDPGPARAAPEGLAPLDSLSRLRAGRGRAVLFCLQLRPFERFAL